MKRIFLFPGQGSQMVGMGKDLALEFAAARLVFEEVDEAFGSSLSQIMFDGDEQSLRLTVNAQPALMAVSMAIIRSLESKGCDIASLVSFMAGHSLGEYSALCASGAISLADTTKLLKIRGEAMQAAVPASVGAMAAIIGLETDKVEQVAKAASDVGVCEVANDNGGLQIVISGEAGAVEKAMGLAKEAGAKRAILLPVSAPFHCSLMQPAAEKMAQALETVAINQLKVPIIANVTAQPIDDIKDIKQLLVKQVTGQVRWRETINWLAGNGATKFYEIGSGRVLTGLARKIAPECEAVSVGTAAAVHSLLDEFSNIG